MTGLIALVLLGVLPPELPHIEDEVDTLEVNVVYSAETGCYNFTQLIGWHGQLEDVGFWRMIQTGEKGAKEQALVPMKGRDGWVVVFDDKGVTRVVRAPYQMEFHAQTDVETNEREELGVHERRELRPAPKRPPFVREIP